jgi:hypothetical protein
VREQPLVEVLHLGLRHHGIGGDAMAQAE